jgi:PleD family two-component response regulator
MPVKNGLTILKELKAIPEVKDIPVIFLTTINERNTVLKCLELGASDYIVKDAMAINEILARISIRLKN